MLPSYSPSHDWLNESEPLLFDDEFCQSLIKDLQSIPTPPQSPPLKTGLGKPLSNVDQLELVSELLLEDNDLFHLNWNGDFTSGNVGHASSSNSVSDDCMWHCAAEKSIEGKLSVLSTSPLLSDIDTEIFAEIAGSTLDCHNAALACQLLDGEDLLLDSPEQSESSSDYGSLSAGGESSASDSEEEIDVVTVRRCSTLTRSQQQEESRREQQRALKRCHLEIQQQHNYAAPRPASPPPPSPSHKRVRGGAESGRVAQHTSRSRSFASRHSADTEDEEERRRTHNVMERQRRNELKNCFLRLRDNVPELSNNDKASKVVILKRAKESIRNLESEDQRLRLKRDKLRDRQELLKARLEQLKRH
ncbi:myelocytomatosis oncogene homolog [Electrophorus electricus]|uniref:BHLH domain-containing protein n=1 Tax=Electrophorus electricus TaxID=8005 RepID=A0A4W4GVE0_ELEEL|nr:myelocytomatosis oncogene homolog [Electrophorus electricus]XP_026866577.2 myelocytomatosis oncogene homolog [Electrophorus electricus]